MASPRSRLAALLLIAILCIAGAVALRAQDGTTFFYTEPGLVVLTTPSVYNPEISSTICSVANVSSGPMEIRTRVIDGNGQILADLLRSVASGRTYVRHASVDAYLRCEWTYNGQPTDVRAALLGYDGGKVTYAVKGE